MTIFVLRRLMTAALAFVAATFVMFLLVVNSGDPLADLRMDTSSGREAKIENRIRTLHLDESQLVRYQIWATGAAGCVLPGLPCDLGTTIQGQSVAEELKGAMGSTIRLVSGAVVLALFLGVAVGVVTAMRQYSGFDYTVTFISFFLFAIPVFWVAVLLKQYLAIGFNDWLADPTLGLVGYVVLGSVSALVCGSLVTSGSRQRWLVRAAGFVISVLLAMAAITTGWMSAPKLGPVVIAAATFGAAVALTTVIAGWHTMNVRRTALTVAAGVSVAQFVVTPFLGSDLYSNGSNVLGTWAVVLLSALLLAYRWGELDRGTTMVVAAGVAAIGMFWILVDLMLRAVPGYTDQVNGRLISTIGSETPNFSGTFWESNLDVFLHLLLPTLAMSVASFAGYSRYMRSSMLETLGADHVRTARAKGLPERTVIIKHALRNALIPISTLVAFDLGALISGALITEMVFGWKGMGLLFVEGLQHTDTAPVMGFFVVTASATIVFNMLADVAYGWLDPRIRFED